MTRSVAVAVFSSSYNMYGDDRFDCNRYLTLLLNPLSAMNHELSTMTNYDKELFKNCLEESY
jgi:hypothetical protein